MTKNYKLINNILGWMIGIFASAIYIMTAEPTASWWDCGEYIATSYKLLVGHPPGAPTFQLLGHIFSLFSGGDVTKVAYCINCMSAICSGLTIMFLFWTITMLGKKLVTKLGEMTPARMVAVFGSALVGSLAYTFTDTFWFSAVEGEVYAMSSFFTALVFWCILKWEIEYDNPVPNANPHRWIVLIAYLIGLSIGVHLLNLLTIPAIVLIIYFKLSKNATIYGIAQTISILSFFVAFFFPPLAMIAIWALITIPLFITCYKHGSFSSPAEWGVLISLLGSFVILGAVLYGVIPYIVKFAGKFEIFFVNSIHLPFNSGTIIFFVLLFGLIAWGLYYGFKNNKKVLLTGVFSFLMLLIGYSTFFILIIRSNVNPTIDENSPEDAISLLAYLNREQYGDTPFLHGRTYNSRPYGYENGDPTYVRDEKSGRYIICDEKKDSKPVYRPDQTVFMPRMYDSGHKANYVNWLYANDPAKANKMMRSNKMPEYQDNIRFMHTYQFGYMYLRYFMWNFSGRQNDIQGMGGKLEGNCITGIPFIDNHFLGEQSDATSNQNKGNNKYYLLPLLLGLIGAVYYSMKDGKNSFIVFMFFIMTGMAIAFYLNMYAFQPRERDYAFAASFYAFSIWIGIGVYALYSFFEKIKSNKIQVVGALLVTLICLGLVPGLMASQNWDDHDRSNRYTALAAAKNYLDSCEPNAILFTMGDNDTFPLWYAQEVEGYRTDVRVCNLSLASAGWYIDQMARKAYESDPLPISMTWEQYHDGVRDVIIMNPADGSYHNIDTVLNIIKDEKFNKSSRLICGRNLPYGGTYVNAELSASFSLPVDREKVIATHTVKDIDTNLIVDKIVWNAPSSIIPRSFMIMLDILAHNNWERPVYFATSMGSDGYFGLENYFQYEGMAYRLVPIRSNGGQGRIDSDILYEKVMNVFNDHTRPDRIKHPDAQHTPYQYAWGGVNDPRVYNSDDNLRTCYYILGMHLRLANQLFNERKLDKALTVIDHCEKVLPDELIPYKMVRNPHYTDLMISLADICHKMSLVDSTQGAKYQAKADEISGKIIAHIRSELNFYNRTDERTLQIHHDNLEDLYANFLPRLADISPTACNDLDFSKTAPVILSDISAMISVNLQNIQSYEIQRQQIDGSNSAAIQQAETEWNKEVNEYAQQIRSLTFLIDLFKNTKNDALAKQAESIYTNSQTQASSVLHPGVMSQIF